MHQALETKPPLPTLAPKKLESTSTTSNYHSLPFSVLYFPSPLISLHLSSTLFQTYPPSPFFAFPSNLTLFSGSKKEEIEKKKKTFALRLFYFMRITHSFKKKIWKKKGLGRSHHSPGVWLQGISVLYGSGVKGFVCGLMRLGFF